MRHNGNTNPYIVEDDSTISQGKIEQIVKALLAGESPNGVRPEDCGVWSEVIGCLYDAYTDGGTDAVRRVFTAWSNADPRVASLASGESTTERHPRVLLDIQPLPPHAHLDPDLAEGCGEWLDQYIKYSSTVSTLSSHLFHESAGLWAASLAIARRLKLELPHGAVYPNLFVCWVAETTLWSKTTTMQIASQLVHDAYPHLLTPQDSTVESLVSDMAGRDPINNEELDFAVLAQWQSMKEFAAQRGWLLDEMSGLLASAGKEYNSGLLEMLMRFYDCEADYKRSTRTQGLVAVRNSYLSFLGASTPSALAKPLKAEALWSNGWWPRFALLVPETDKPKWVEERAVIRPANLLEGLKRLYERLPKPAPSSPPQAASVVLADGVLQAWRAYAKVVRYDMVGEGQLPKRLYGTYGRIPAQVAKIAIILAALDWPDDGSQVPTITLAHLARAIQIAEGWRTSAHRLLILIDQEQSGQLGEQILRKITQFEPRGASLAELAKGWSVDRKALAFELAELVKEGQLELTDAPSGSKGGRPTQRYRLARG